MSGVMLARFKESWAARVMDEARRVGELTLMWVEKGCCCRSEGGGEGRERGEGMGGLRGVRVE